MHSPLIKSTILTYALVVCMMISFAQSATTLQYTGVNEAGAEFGDYQSSLSSRTYPAESSILNLFSKGMNIFRVPFMWERMQTSLGANLDSSELAKLTSTVNYITGLGATALIDNHNYARYRGNIIGSSSVPTAMFKDFWTKAASAFKSNPKVIFGLMNEPHDMPTRQWLDAANAAIQGIRSVGATQMIFISGNGYDSAGGWTIPSPAYYGDSNSVVMLDIVDPLDNYAFEVHAYFDSDYSGQHTDCTHSPLDAVTGFTSWLNQHGEKGFLGEFAGGNNANCQQQIDSLLDYLEDNSNVWLGWTWWSAGPWWGNYIFSLEPNSDGSEKPQFAWLQPHLQTGGGGAPSSPSSAPAMTPSKSSQVTKPTPSHTPKPKSGKTVFADGLTSPWILYWSWNSLYNVNNPTPSHSGKASLLWNNPGFNNGLFFVCDPNGDDCFDSTYTSISGWINSGKSKAIHELKVQLRRNSNIVGSLISVKSTANGKWKQFTIPISAFNAGAGPFNGFTIMGSANTLPVYLDDIVLK